MKSYSQWKRDTIRKLRIRAEEDRDSSKGILFHSIFYHRFFEGYKETYETGADGKPHLKRTYAGMWYVQKLDQKKYVLVRAGYVLLFALLVLFLVLAARLQGISGTALYVVIPEILIVLMLFRIFYILIASYLFAPKKMTIHDYESSSGALKGAALILAGVEALAFLATLLFGLLHLGQTAFPLTAALVFLAGALISCAIFFIENKVPYEEVFNKEGEKAPGLQIE